MLATAPVRPARRTRRPACAAASLRALLTGAPRSGRLLACSRYAAYVELTGQPGVALAVTTSDAVRLPFAVRLGEPSAAAPLAGLDPADPVTVGAGGLQAGQLEAVVRRWCPAAPRIRRLATGDLHAWRQAVLRAGRSGRPGLPPGGAPAEFAAALARRDPAAAAAAAAGLVGRGPGSTPSGDDLVGAALAAMRLLAPAHPAAGELWAACGEALAAAVLTDLPARTTPLSAALLRCAARGEVIAELAGVLQGAGSEPRRVEAAAARLLRVGHSSGADCLQGLAAVAGALRPGGEPAAGTASGRIREGRERE